MLLGLSCTFSWNPWGELQDSRAAHEHEFTNLPGSVALSSHSTLPFMSSCDLLSEWSKTGTIGWIKSPWVKPAQSTKCSYCTELLPYRDLGILKLTSMQRVPLLPGTPKWVKVWHLSFCSICVSGVEALLSSPLRFLCWHCLLLNISWLPKFDKSCRLLGQEASGTVLLVAPWFWEAGVWGFGFVWVFLQCWTSLP